MEWKHKINAVPLPKPGDVWGVPGKPETRRFICGVRDTPPECQHPRVDYVDFGGKAWMRATSWRNWVSNSGAVNLVADLDALAARVRELEAKVFDAENDRDEWMESAEVGVQGGYEVAAEWRNKAEAAVRESNKLKAELAKARGTQVSGRIAESAAKAGWHNGERLSDFITRLAEERGKLKASRERLLEGLRRIQQDAGGVYVRLMVSEILAAEEGVGK